MGCSVISCRSRPMARHEKCARAEHGSTLLAPEGSTELQRKSSSQLTADQVPIVLSCSMCLSRSCRRGRSRRGVSIS